MFGNKKRSPEELRKIKFEIIVCMISEDTVLQNQLKEVLR